MGRGGWVGVVGGWRGADNVRTGVHLLQHLVDVARVGLLVFAVALFLLLTLRTGLRPTGGVCVCVCVCVCVGGGAHDMDVCVYHVFVSACQKSAAQEVMTISSDSDEEKDKQSQNAMAMRDKRRRVDKPSK